MSSRGTWTVALGLAVAAVLTGCASGGEDVEATPAPGSSAAPLALGEAARVSPESAFTVALTAFDPDATDVVLAATPGLDAPPDGQSYVVGTFAVTVDEAALAAQGFDLARDGADPGLDLTFEHVAADGTVTTLSTTTCVTPDGMHRQPTVHEDGGTVVGEICLTMPTELAVGGTWHVTTVLGEGLWIATP